MPEQTRTADPRASASRPGLQRIVALAQHEVRAAGRSRVLVVMTVVLSVVSIASVLVAAAEYRGQVADYRAYAAAATASGLSHVPPPPLALLTLLRGAFEYLEIVGAVLAISLGYLSVSRERIGRTLPLLRSRPVAAGEQAAGMLLGTAALIGAAVAATALASVLALGLVGNDWPSGLLLIKLALAYLAAVAYLLAFYCLGAIATSRARVPAIGLMVALGVWLVVVLILPQIGDTMDADNQLPGGLFGALGVGHQGEVDILAHFRGYETVRTSIEWASLEKHFERFAFAMIDIKPRYRGLGLGGLLGVAWVDIAFVVVALLGMGAWLRLAVSRQISSSHHGRKTR